MEIFVPPLKAKEPVKGDSPEPDTEEADGSDMETDSSLEGILQGHATKLKDRDGNYHVVSRKVALLKQQIINLNNLGKGLACYSQECNLQAPSKLSISELILCLNF